jgi:putative phosphoribosyl transferase
MSEGEVAIPVERGRVRGDLAVPEGAEGVVVFAHGSGSSRHSPRNREVARRLHALGLGTLLMDLLTTDEESADEVSGEYRFDIDLLGRRLLGAALWLREQWALRDAPLGYFGASTGAGAALWAAAEEPEWVRAIVCRSGRPELAGPRLMRVVAPTLFIVGELDSAVLMVNQAAREDLRGPTELRVVPGAGHLFAEEGALEEAARLAGEWFRLHLAGPGHPPEEESE